VYLQLDFSHQHLLIEQLAFYLQVACHLNLEWPKLIKRELKIEIFINNNNLISINININKIKTMYKKEKLTGSVISGSTYSQNAYPRDIAVMASLTKLKAFNGPKEVRSSLTF
jgi:hypothetical protein